MQTEKIVAQDYAPVYEVVRSESISETRQEEHVLLSDLSCVQVLIDHTRAWPLTLKFCPLVAPRVLRALYIYIYLGSISI